ncbi:GD23652 [Drosophila simulans]|uniref:GD23652 n=1 Tax=Drosophila simulans TaxID=7240 RepID=B4Q8N2_DROSI|nr:GD23652 [Drosophila simulans]
MQDLQERQDVELVALVEQLTRHPLLYSQLSPPYPFFMAVKNTLWTPNAAVR